MFGGFHLSWMGIFYGKSSTWAKEAVVFFVQKRPYTWACIGNNKLNSSKLIKDILLVIHFIWRFFPCYTCHARILENTFLSTKKKKKKKKMRKNVLKSFCLVACVIILLILYISCFGCISIFVALWLCGFVALWLCVFVSLYVRMFVAEANKVEGTTSRCVRTNEILASNR